MAIVVNECNNCAAQRAALWIGNRYRQGQGGAESLSRCGLSGLKVHHFAFRIGILGGEPVVSAGFRKEESGWNRIGTVRSRSWNDSRRRPASSMRRGADADLHRWFVAWLVVALAVTIVAA